MNFKNLITGKNLSFVILVLSVIFLLIQMTDVAMLLFGSYVISSSINPIVDKMSEKMSRSLATIIMITIITIVTLGLFTPIIIMSISEIKSFLEQLPQQITNLQNFIDTFKIGGQSIAQYLNLDVVLSNSTEIAKGIIDKSINFTLGIFGLLTILATLGIIVYFLTNDRDKIKLLQECKDCLNSEFYAYWEQERFNSRAYKFGIKEPFTTDYDCVMFDEKIEYLEKEIAKLIKKVRKNRQ